LPTFRFEIDEFIDAGDSVVGLGAGSRAWSA
jgi:hypothetical protein